jgi:hypothetical protein
MAGWPQPTRPRACALSGLGYHGSMRRRPAAPGPMFGWAGDSGWRLVAAWLLRSAIIVALAVAVYVALFYLVLPLVLDR